MHARCRGPAAAGSALNQLPAACLQVQHFQQMLVRNAANPSLAKQVKRRLEEVQAELARELAEQARMKGSIKGSENQRKAMKF